MPDMVNHPPHYLHGGIETIDYIDAVTKDMRGSEAVCTANAIKYLSRWKDKGGAEDLKKAKWYIDHLLAQLTVSTVRSDAGADITTR